MRPLDRAIAAYLDTWPDKLPAIRPKINCRPDCSCSVQIAIAINQQLLRLSSIKALRKSGFLEKTLWLKLNTAYLFHAYKAIEGFIGFAHKPSQKFIYSRDFLSQCSEVFSRDEKKQIKKMKKLRNAFVHYDFEDLIDSTVSSSRNFDLLLETAIESTMKMDLSQYESFLSTVVDKAIMNLKAITGFPEYDPRRNVFGRV